MCTTLQSILRSLPSFGLFFIINQRSQLSSSKNPKAREGSPNTLQSCTHMGHALFSLTRRGAESLSGKGGIPSRNRYRGTESLSGKGGNPPQNRYLGEPGFLETFFFCHTEHVAERKDQLRTEQLERAN